MARAGRWALATGVLMMAGNAVSAEPGWTRYGLEQGLPSLAVQSLAVDGAGRLWVGMLGGGLAVFDGARFSAYEPQLVGTPHVRGLAWSPRGELWAATDAGAVRIAGSQTQWMKAGTPGLLTADLLRVIPDVGGKTWLLAADIGMSEPRGLSAWDGQRLEALAAPEGQRLGSVLAVVVAPACKALGTDAGELLVVAGGGLYRPRDGALQPVSVQGTPLWRPTPHAADEEVESRRLPPVSLTAAHQARDGTIWFVHPRAVIALGAEGFHELKSPAKDPLGPWLAEASDGTVYVAAFGGPLLHLGPQAKLLESIVLPLHAGESVDELVAGPAANLWIATTGRPGNVLRGMPTARTEGLRIRARRRDWRRRRAFLGQRASGGSGRESVAGQRQRAVPTPGPLSPGVRGGAAGWGPLTLLAAARIVRPASGRKPVSRRHVCVCPTTAA